MTITFRHLASGASGDTEIAGSGLRVYTVLNLYATGGSPEAIAESYGVPVAAIFEALAYASDHPEEMDAIRRADDAADDWSLTQLPEHLRSAAQAIRRADERAYRKAVRKAKLDRLGSPVP
jgi:uncharacterized protein (DUF433 family)